MTDASPSDDVFEEILREHSKLQSMLSELKELLFERTADFSEVARRLAELRSMIESHFRTEEDSGCFGDLVNHAPHMSDRVEALIVEHGDLSSLIDDLARRASKCQGQPQEWDEIGGRFGEFFDKLSSHESLENELLQHVFTEDIGSKD